MNESASQFAYLRDPRMSAHAVDAAPAWLWTTDGTRILWTNAVGAAIFGAAEPAALAGRRFAAEEPAARQIARIAGTLPLDGPQRLERLRGFGAELGRPLTCGCARISLPGTGAAVLVVAAEAAGPALPLDERLLRLVAGMEAPVAVFSAEGALLHATAPALPQFAATATLATLGAEALATHALRAGYASGPSHIGALSIERIGRDPATFLVATLAAPQTAGGQSPRAAPSAPVQDTSAPAVPEQTVAEPMQPQADVFASEGTSGSEAQSPQAPAYPGAGQPPGAPERRHPLRFVWQMDADSRFTIEAGDFVRLAGPSTAQALGRPWNEIARLLAVDPQDQVARAVASHDTWSGITLDWPVDGTDESLNVELSGLPVFDRNRAFSGYRGFGVCRDARKISLAAALRYPPGRSARTEAAASRHAVAEERPALAIVPPVENVVPFPTPPPAERAPSLSPVERSAFQELAQKLTSRLKRGEGAAEPAPPKSDDGEATASREETAAQDAAYGRVEGETGAMGFIQPHNEPPQPPAAGPGQRRAVAAPAAAQDERAILDRLPLGVLIYRIDTPLYANPAFLDWSGYDSAAALTAAGGLDALLVEARADNGAAGAKGGPSLTVKSNRGEQDADARLFTVSWEGDTAHVLMVTPAAAPAAAALPHAAAELRELKSILDMAADGVLVLDGEGRVLAGNRSAEALFGYDAQTLAQLHFAELFTSESARTALDYVRELARGAGAGPSNGREVIGRVRDGELAPLLLTIGRLGEGAEKFCAVFRDLRPWKKSEEELIRAKRQAERASSAKSEFLAKLSHEMRTPLNSIIGFSEVMMAERFGPLANERYLAYLKDIHESGAHLVALLNDLLDLSKIEAGKMELDFASINLNEAVQQCVALMQPQANQEKIIIRTSLPPGLPPIVADARSLRQIVLNLLSNSIKFTGAGGQVIVSTALADNGEVVLRVRDTGAGMSENEIQLALEPFRQLATSSRRGAEGTGLGLPITKALAEANRASFAIKSSAAAGTLVEISFPASRALAAS
jgi:PAS domain S-box-containing protein